MGLQGVTCRKIALQRDADERKPLLERTLSKGIQAERPLSPHLTVYRPQLTSMSSILTRITGNALLLGMVLFVCWILAASTSLASFEFVNAFATSWFGWIIWFGSLWALWYHLLAGLRHLIWDQGWMLEIGIAERLGWGVIIGSFVLTGATIAIL